MTGAEENQEICQNCGTPIREGAAYCSSCGQANKPSRIPLWSALRDIFEQVFDLDSKLLRTLRGLLLPGQLTRYYFAGRRKSFLHPARLFLISAVVLLALFSFRTLQLVHNDIERNFEVIRARGYHQKELAKLYVDIDSLRDLRPQDASWQMALDSLSESIGEPDSTLITLGLFSFSWKTGIQTSSREVRWKDLLTLPMDELLKKYEIENYWERLFLEQIARVARDGKGFYQFVLGQLSWMLLLMMPAIALVLKLFYIRRGRYFVEHLYFTFHTHSFVFLLFGLAVLVNPRFGIWGGLALVGSAVYVYLAFLRYYSQSWFKTLVKVSLISYLYFIIVVIFFALTILLSGLFYS